MRLKYLLIILLYWFCINPIISQDFALYPNMNPRYELEQKVEQNKLILKGEYPISKVDIYKRTTKELFEYINSSNSIEINLNNFDISYYTIMVYTNVNDIIILGLDILKMNYVENDIATTTIEDTEEIILTETKTKEVKAYWVIKEVKKHSGSTLSTYFSYNKERIDTAIQKNVRDIKSFSGRGNTITVYEIYDLKEFAKHGLKRLLVKSNNSNENFIYDENQKKAFNTNPLYQSKDLIK